VISALATDVKVIVKLAYSPEYVVSLLHLTLQIFAVVVLTDRDIISSHAA